MLRSRLSGFRLKLLARGHVRWGVGQVGTAMKAEAMSGRGKSGSSLMRPLVVRNLQAQHTQLPVLGLEGAIWKLLKAKPSHGIH